MASDYGPNFGWRRSDESMVTREGRQKVPVVGVFRLGAQVEIDPASPGYMKVSPGGGDVSGGGFVGILVQEEIWSRSIYSPTRIDSFYYGVALNNRLAAIWSGAGAKLWFKNTVGQTRADGRVIAAVTMVNLAAVAVGDYLTWNGTLWIKGTAANSLLRVTLTNGTDYVEAVLVH